MGSPTALQAVRRELGYSTATVITLMNQRARTHNIAIMSAASLKTKLSRWENGHEAVGLPEYRRLFREIYGRTDAELGFPTNDTPTPADDLRTRIAAARTVDAATVAAFRAQIDATRRIDRQFGGLSQLDQLRQEIDQIRDLLAHGIATGRRAALAAALTEASTLAGWQALDRDDTPQAWAHYERAKRAAREADSQLLLAHATAEQTFVLTALGEHADATTQADYARTLADHGPPLLRAWLAAAHGETLAIHGERDAALRAFDDADHMLPADPVDSALPFVFLSEVHLERWRGNALAHLGDPDAIDRLTHALADLPPAWVRARAALLVDLALAHAAAGDREAALTHARAARRAAQQIHSDRTLRRLAALVLPAGRRPA
jgi:ATP/maltotriose-dependent transcriptional regulator MalT